MLAGLLFVLNPSSREDDFVRRCVSWRRVEATADALNFKTCTLAVARGDARNDLVFVRVDGQVCWIADAFEVINAHHSLFSLFPLCVKDDLANIFPMFVVFYAFTIIKLLPDASRLTRALHTANAALTSLLAIAMLLVPPTARFPDIFSLAFAAYSFAIFSACFLYMQYRNFATDCRSFTSLKKRKIA